MQITPPGFRRRDRLLPRFQVPPHRPGPTPTAVSSQAPPPRLFTTNPILFSAVWRRHQAPPLSQTRRSTHRHFPPFSSSILEATPPPPHELSCRLRRSVPHHRQHPRIPSAEAQLTALPHQLSPARSGRSRPLSPFSIWRCWFSRPGTASRCGSRSSAVAGGFSATAAIAIRPSLTTPQWEIGRGL